ncbi:hypothetical protein CTAYLR_002339 [Chrysophaeum taylorii]|uniref:AAA+ ATPase domain-containing protein n=1 Tax=Chrysophaeum taylorii TaxID=2483200 RepID=A0AAD7XN74_9STRA|nr:hypothetical protein CTAYLR_002339 [Chrysophaeum taylorii]
MLGGLPSEFVAVVKAEEEATDVWDKLNYAFAALEVLDAVPASKRPPLFEALKRDRTRRFRDLSCEAALATEERGPVLRMEEVTLWETEEEMRRDAPWLFDEPGVDAATQTSTERRHAGTQTAAASSRSIRDMMGAPREEEEEEEEEVLVPPARRRQEQQHRQPSRKKFRVPTPTGQQQQQQQQQQQEKAPEVPERLKQCDPELVKRIENEIMDRGDAVTFDDVAGLEGAKGAIREMVIWPMRRPELFTGLRAVPKGMLLFGPPGTGKTLIGRAIASSCEATFFSISASSLVSKWIGESEKLVRALFAVAGYREPSVVFVDEVDSLLSQRSSDENEASRRLKTEFLVQLEGVDSSKAKERVLVVGATNRPQELDEAARRRFVKRFHVPLPDATARYVLFSRLLSKNNNTLSDPELRHLVDRTHGFSGADVRNLCQEAAMGPMRDVGSRLFGAADQDDVAIPPIAFSHFEAALRITRASVSPADLVGYDEWDRQFGTQR